MDEKTLRNLIGEIQSGSLQADDALAKLRALSIENLGFANLDHHREIRCGFPEVIYCEGKTVDQVAEIFVRLAAAGGNVLATRASLEQGEAVGSREGQRQWFRVPQGRPMARWRPRDEGPALHTGSLHRGYRARHGRRRIATHLSPASVPGKD